MKITWPTINWDDVITKLVTWMIIGLLFISLQLITTQSIDGYQELKETIATQQQEINDLKEHHDEMEVQLEEAETPWRVKIWRTVTLYELRK